MPGALGQQPGAELWCHSPGRAAGDGHSCAQVASAVGIVSKGEGVLCREPSSAASHSLAVCQWLTGLQIKAEEEEACDVSLD